MNKAGPDSLFYREMTTELLSESMKLSSISLAPSCIFEPSHPTSGGRFHRNICMRYSYSVVRLFLVVRLTNGVSYSNKEEIVTIRTFYT